MLALFDLIFYVPVNNFSVISEGLPELNQYLAEINEFCIQPPTPGSSVLTQALYH